jgi:hypothetical protein
MEFLEAAAIVAVEPDVAAIVTDVSAIVTDLSAVMADVSAIVSVIVEGCLSLGSNGGEEEACS